MQKIDFKDYPDTSTPLNSINLNMLQQNVENEFVNNYNNLSNYYSLLVGTLINNGDDLNNYTTPGIYTSPNSTITNSLINCPYSGDGFKLIVEYINNNTTIRQTIITGTSNIINYARLWSASSWNVWLPVNSPFPTNIGIRSGQMKNGRLLIQWGTIGITPSAANAPTSTNITFPQTYSNPPTVMLAIDSAVPGSQVTGFSHTGITNTGATLYLTRTNTTATTIDWIAIGQSA